MSGWQVLLTLMVAAVVAGSVRFLWGRPVMSGRLTIHPADGEVTQVRLTHRRGAAGRAGSTALRIRGARDGRAAVIRITWKPAHGDPRSVVLTRGRRVMIAGTDIRHRDD